MSCDLARSVAAFGLDDLWLIPPPRRLPAHRRCLQPRSIYNGGTGYDALAARLSDFVSSQFAPIAYKKPLGASHFATLYPIPRHSVGNRATIELRSTGASNLQDLNQGNRRCVDDTHHSAHFRRHFPYN
jgi:hypothetical protein